MSVSPDSNILDVWSLVDHYLIPIKPFFDIDGVSEIMVNSHDSVYIEVFGEKKKVDARWESEFQLQSCIEQVANALGQKVNTQTHPNLDARLPDGSRVNALLSPYAAKGHCMTIRLFPKVRLTPDDLLLSGSFTSEMLEYFKAVMLDEANVILSGSTGSGKTTLLNMLGNFIPDSERIITIEDTLELQIEKPHMVATEAAVRAAFGDAQLTMGDLLKNALRMNPDRLVLGELRDAGAADTFLKAINTGHSGIVTTLHANSASDALTRLDGMVAGAATGKPWEAIQAEVRSNVDVVIQVKKIAGQGRRVTEVAEIVSSECSVLWAWNFDERKHVRTSVGSRFFKG